MSFKYLTVLLACVFCSSSFSAPLFTQQKPVAQMSFVDLEQKFQKEMARIDSFRFSHDIDSFKDVVLDIQQQWDDKDINLYSSLMLKVCQTLSTIRADGTAELSSKYALDILDKNDIPIENEVYLDLFLTPLRENEGNEIRNILAEKWLRTWQRIHDGIIKNFDFSMPKYINVMPPAGAGIMPGGDPNAIVDLELRAQYTTAIAENKRVFDITKNQRDLRMYDEMMTLHIQKYLVPLFLKDHDDAAELRKYLNIYVQETTFKNKILAEVNAAIEKSTKIVPAIKETE